MIEAIGMKAQGVLPGASDLIVIHVTYTGVTLLWIEVKAEAGRQSAEQVDFQARVEALGYMYHIVKSVDQFNALIQAI